ncbi:DUF222 domain-containing protein, partial [Agromyces aerolatus]|uniref:DUF222 domain-containing protein n=1 Tax=Agromyces sp. LY-1074 TaxID=3074080 RepID=UPI002865AB51
MRNSSIDRLRAELGTLAETWSGALPAFGPDTIGADTVGAGAGGAEAGGAEFEALSGPGLIRVVEAMTHMRRSLDAVLARAADEVAKRSAPGFGAEGLAKQHGYASPARLVAAATGGAQAEASRLLAVGEATRARASFTGEHLPAKFASVRAALDHGAVSIEAAAAITGMLRRVEHRAEAALLAPYEQRLVEFAAREPLSLVLRAVKTAEARLDQDGAAPADERMFTERALTLHEDQHGMFHLRGRLDPVTAAPIKAALDTLVNDTLTRRNPGTTSTNGATGTSGTSDAIGAAGATGAAGSSDGPVVDDDRSIPQIQADALAELARHALGCTTGPGT